jgi:hypothetical protein
MTGRRNVSTPVTRNTPIEQAQANMRSIAPAIKDATEAKIHLCTKGWILPGEEVTLDTLARTLFAFVAENNKLSPNVVNPILAAAYIITEKLENNLKDNITDAISKKVVEAFLPFATNFESKLNDHIQAVNEATKTHNELADKIQVTQNQLDETNERVTTNAKSYSQAAATSPPPPPHHPNQNLTHSQIQIRNREEIKRRQVLINFIRTNDMALETFDERTLSRKATDAINTIWAATEDPKPALPKLKAATLLRNGGLLLELNSATSADWLREPENRDTFLTNLGSGASIKDRSYQVIIQFAPVQFNPEDEEQLRQYEIFNGLDPHAILKAEWIKAPKDRKPDQRVTTLRFYHRDSNSANSILKEGASIMNKRVTPKKPKKEPIRCLQCQRFGHERRECHYETPTCPRCAEDHTADVCPTKNAPPRCSNCQGPHPSYSRECPTFWDRCRLIDQRCPENKLAFYPSADPWTWVTIDRPDDSNNNDHPNNHNQQPTNQHHHHTRPQPRTSGANSVPIGRHNTNYNAQSQPHPPSQ